MNHTDIDDDDSFHDGHGIPLHGAADFAAMRKAGALAASLLDDMVELVRPGITTDELNDICHAKTIAAGAVSAPLGYRGFPKSICTSVNHVVCHGIPDARRLVNGDMVNIDVTVIVDGWHGDSSRTYWVGDVSTRARRLTEVTYAAMMKGIEVVRPGATTGDIGHAIQTYAESFGYSVVREYCGHGLGKVFHTAPNILHFGKPGEGVRLEEGMFFTVEPMINIGKAATILSRHDGWTVTTRDKSLSAQFEHALGVTATGFEIFTTSAKGLHCPPFGK
ncbi:MAG: type I methionyl aminopeptidase [Alphaproteobacteria bacterium]|nr:type I methionyl aminopeptidase [Alphaproteobacteria bacterium]